MCNSVTEPCIMIATAIGHMQLSIGHMQLYKSTVLSNILYKQLLDLLGTMNTCMEGIKTLRLVNKNIYRKCVLQCSTVHVPCNSSGSFIPFTI